MIARKKNQIRSLVIQEMYNTRLSQLFEQAPPDPTAAATEPAADTSAETPPPDPAAEITPPAADPAAAALPPIPVPGAGALAGAIPPMPGAPAAPTPATKKPVIVINAEEEPIKSHLNKAMIKATNSAKEISTESLRKRSLRFLFEQDEAESPKIDIGVFSDEVARLINNYTSLVDIKKSVITQAERSLDNQFPGKSEPLKKKLKDLLRSEYHIFLDKPEAPSDSYAVGATSGGGGAA
jgi:hypothetical protein